MLRQGPGLEIGRRRSGAAWRRERGGRTQQLTWLGNQPWVTWSLLQTCPSIGWCATSSMRAAGSTSCRVGCTITISSSRSCARHCAGSRGNGGCTTESSTSLVSSRAGAGTPSTTCRLASSRRGRSSRCATWSSSTRCWSTSIATARTQWPGTATPCARALPLTVVMTVSLGHRRRFRVRPRGGGPTLLDLHPGEGDLVVMGGRMQHDYEHTVPRERVVGGARMSVTMRHSRPVSAR